MKAHEEHETNVEDVKDENKDEDEDEDEDEDKSVLMMMHNMPVVLNMDGGDSDKEGSLAAAFDVLQMGCFNNNNNNKDNVDDGYYYKDRTQVEEATTYPKPLDEYFPSDPKINFGEPAWSNVHNPGDWANFLLDVPSSLDMDLQGNTRDESFTTKIGFLKNTPIFSHMYTSSTDIFPQKGKESLIWRSLGNMDFNLEDNKLTLGKGSMLKESSSLSLFASMVLSISMVLNLHGALEGKKGSICYRWIKLDMLHSPDITKEMSLHLWRQIKSNLKLNCNYEAKYGKLLCKDDMSQFNYTYTDNFSNGDSILDRLPKSVFTRRMSFLYLLRDALTVLTAFNMYQELTDGTHGPARLLPKRQQLDLRGFKQKLAEQMLTYNPSDKACYPVDVLLREVTQSSTKQRRYIKGFTKALCPEAQLKWRKTTKAANPATSEANTPDDESVQLVDVESSGTHWGIL
eukprot:jgi/Psemu1/25047/gm1.25047_g